MKESILAVSVLVAAAIVVAGWSPSMNAADSDPEISDFNGPLDGMTFIGALGPDGEPKDIPDVFVFENGTFVSKECELKCKYPARPYFIRVNGTKTEFISETRCPYKDAKIVWRGTVDGDTIKGKSTWVVKRWYWTVENTFEFEGKLSKQPVSITSSN